MPISRRTWTTMSPPSSDVSGGSPPTWQQVDEGWGRRAVDFATLSEPSNCREYVALHHHLAVGPGDRLLDMACGSGLAVELATAVGATCSGIDASPRLIAVARDRNPDADLRAGDMPRASVARCVVRRRHQLSGNLGDDARSRRRGVPRSGSWWAVGHHRVGSYQALSGGLDDGATEVGDRAKGGASGGDGGARPA